MAAETKKYLSPSIILNITWNKCIVNKNSREKQFRLGDQYEITTVEHDTSGREINFFSDSYLAPKFFKVVTNSKKVGRYFQRQTKPFFHAVIVLEIKLGKRSLTCYKVDTRMDDVLRLGHKLNEEVCCGFIFANLFNSLYL